MFLQISLHFSRPLNIYKNYTLTVAKSNFYRFHKYIQQSYLIAYRGCYGLHYAKRDC